MRHACQVKVRKQGGTVKQSGESRCSCQRLSKRSRRTESGEETRGAPRLPDRSPVHSVGTGPLVPGGLGSGPHRTQGDRGGHPLPRHRVTVPAATDRGWTERMGTGTSAQGGGDVAGPGAWPGLALCEGRQALPPGWVTGTQTRRPHRRPSECHLRLGLCQGPGGGRMSGRACHARPAPRQGG